MRHHFSSAAVLAVGLCAASSSAQALSEGFDQLTSFQFNMSSPTYLGLQSGAWWGYSPSGGAVSSPASGDPGFIAPQAGSGAANFHYTAVGSCYLMSPVVTLENGMSISVWSRIRTTAWGGTESLKLQLSTSGSSLSGSSFTTTLLHIGVGSSDNSQGTPSWTQYSATISGLSGPVSGRFAFLYETFQGYGWAIDTVTYGVAPAPGALALLGVAGLAGSRRRRA